MTENNPDITYSVNEDRFAFSISKKAIGDVLNALPPKLKPMAQLVMAMDSLRIEASLQEGGLLAYLTALVPVLAMMCISLPPEFLTAAEPSGDAAAA